MVGIPLDFVSSAGNGADDEHHYLFHLTYIYELQHGPREDGHE
jgi:hypothetical protein